MRVKVHMLAFDEPGVIRQVTLPGEHCAAMKDADLLELVFHYGQNDFAIGPEKNKACSVSVGDVIELADGRLFMVKPTGVALIDADAFADYQALPRQDRHFHSLQD